MSVLKKVWLILIKLGKKRVWEWELGECRSSKCNI